MFRKIRQELLSERTRKRSERIIIFIAIASFVIHLLFILFNKMGLLPFETSPRVLINPIEAVYTPFSFILIYEVYLLVYYLPKSITSYIGKQYEIITLIVIRRIFKDISNLELTSDWFQVKNDLQFTYDIIATLLLFLLIYIFYRLKQRAKAMSLALSSETSNFIKRKKSIAAFLVPVLVLLASYSFGNWIYQYFFLPGEIFHSLIDVNRVFFDDFFTVLILTDVLLLLLSFLYTDRFNKVIRNSGFIISTVLLKLSFSVEGLLNTLLIVVAVSFGVLILTIHNKYEKIQE